MTRQIKPVLCQLIVRFNFLDGFGLVSLPSNSKTLDIARSLEAMGVAINILKLELQEKLIKIYHNKLQILLKMHC